MPTDLQQKPHTGTPLTERLFHTAFGVVLLGLLAACCIAWPYKSRAALAAGAVLGVGLWWGLRTLGPAVDSLPRRWFEALFWACAGGYLVVLTLAGLSLREVLISDLGVVYQSLAEFLTEGHPTYSNDYYLMCNNNLGLALLLALFYRLTGIWPDGGAGLSAGICFNCGMIACTVLLVCRAAQLLTGRQSVRLLALLCCMAFAPFYLWAPYFYSDTLCMPFLMGALVLFLQYLRRPRWWLAVLAGVVSCAGFAVKGSLAVLPVAFAIVLLVRSRDWRGALAVVLGFVVLLGAYRAFNRRYLDWSAEERVGFPTELWLCYGSHGLGDYDQTDADFCQSLSSLTERRQLLRKRIAENYASRSLPETLVFEVKKAAVTWGDGEYGAKEYLSTPLRSSPLHKFTLEGQPGFMPLAYYCQAWQYLLLGLTALGSLLAARRRDDAFAARVALFGVMLFLSLWETKARYALHFAPVLLLCAVLTLDRLTRRAPARERELCTV